MTSAASVSSLTAGAAASALLAACGEQVLAPTEDPESGHLVSRPGAAVFTPAIGTSPLGLGRTRDGLLFVPSTYKAGEARPLMLTLHGAGGDAYGGMQPFIAFAESARVILLSPDSRDSTWDRRFGSFGADSRFIDNALSEAYLHCTIDPARIAIAGFSDGASYALSLGLTNGDLFTQILAFSPGFMVPNVRRGLPKVYVAHGTRDTVLPIATTSRSFVPRLRNRGYDVTYNEFDGTHQLTPSVAADAFVWLRSAWQIPSAATL